MTSKPDPTPAGMGRHGDRGPAGVRGRLAGATVSSMAFAKARPGPRPAQARPEHLAGAHRGARLVGRPRLLLGILAFIANGVPALALLFYLRFLLPGAGVLPNPTDASRTSLIALGAMILAAVVTGTLANARALLPILRWLAAERPATDAERLAVLREPLRQALTAMAFWTAAAIVFGTIQAALGLAGARVAALVIGIVLAGVAGAALSILLVERALRPLVAEALDGDLPARRYGVGVLARILMAWAFGSGVPLFGLLLAPIGAGHRSLSSFVLPLSVLCAGGLVLGLTITAGAGRSIAEPLAGIRDALARVEAGDLDVKVVVDEASEVGELQAGVNRMVAGLRQRQVLEDLFGRYVGAEVASGAMERGIELSGRRLEATALFVDLIGSSALAEAVPPEQVVRALNGYFAAVVRVVSAEGGWVNKFEGDGALCVFGPPADADAHAARALRAAARIPAEVAQVATEDLPLSAAVGVSSGQLVGGNIGSAQRFEYTVIGDPVNEASRLTEQAKAHPGRVLASGATVSAAGAEGRRWEVVATTVLRGRRRPTTIFAPTEESS